MMSRTLNKLFVAILLGVLCPGAYGVDTDGDGLLDLIDVPGFDPSATGFVDYGYHGIQDLDGANLFVNAKELLLHCNQITNIESGQFDGLGDLQGLWLFGNQITSVERADFRGMSNLLALLLGGNQITSIANGSFQELGKLQILELSGNQITQIPADAFQSATDLQSLDLRDNQIATIDRGAFRGMRRLRNLNLDRNGESLKTLNLVNAQFDNLQPCGESRSGGFCLNSSPTSLILNDAQLNGSSFDAVLDQLHVINTASLVGLGFDDDYPTNLNKLLGIPTLHNIIVDPLLFSHYATEFHAFDALPGNTVTVVPEPGTVELGILLFSLVWFSHRQNKPHHSPFLPYSQPLFLPPVTVGKKL